MPVIFPAAAAADLEDKHEARRQKGRRPRRRGNPMRALMSAFPLFIIPVGIYCLIALTSSGDPVSLTHNGVILSEKASPLMGLLGEKFFAIGMIGGEIEWVLTKGDALLLLHQRAEQLFHSVQRPGIRAVGQGVLGVRVGLHEQAGDAEKQHCRVEFELCPARWSQTGTLPSGSLPEKGL